MIWNLEEFFLDKNDCLNSIEKMNDLYNKVEKYKFYDYDNMEEINKFFNIYKLYKQIKDEFSSYFDLLEMQNYQDSTLRILKDKFKLMNKKMKSLFDIVFFKLETKIEKHKQNKNYKKYKYIIENYNLSKEDECIRCLELFDSLNKDVFAANVSQDKFKYTYLKIINDYFNSLIENLDDSYVEEILNYHSELTRNELSNLFKIVSKNSYLNTIYEEVMREDIILKNPNIDYLEGQKKVLESLSILGQDYKNELKNIFDHNRIDYEIRKNKSDSDFTYGTKNHQAYISINYQKDIESLLTLSHELGHAVEHNKKYKQTLLKKIPSSELYSLTNELITGNYLLKNANTLSEKLDISLELLRTYMTNMFEILALSNLTLKVGSHIEKNGYITLKNINTISTNIINKYNLPAQKNFWITPDIFENMDQIIYTYGIIGASNIYSSIEDRKFNVNDYKECLKQSKGSTFEIFDILECNPVKEDNIIKSITNYKKLLMNTEDLVYEMKKRRKNGIW